MVERWVINASPLIVLARIGQEQLFFGLATELAVPRAVAEEIELARQQGLIPSAAGLLQQLQDNGFRLKDALIQEVLRRTVGESW